MGERTPISLFYCSQKRPFVILCKNICTVKKVATLFPSNSKPTTAGGCGDGGYVSSSSNNNGHLPPIYSMRMP